MSLFEWIGERFSPGPIGDIDSDTPDPGHWDPRIIVLRGVIAVVLLTWAAYAIIAAAGSAGPTFVALAALAIYCVAGYRLRPRPDYDNVGWLGGLIDNPFRISDDYNRWLVAFVVLLWPGRFVAVSVRDLVGFLRGRRIIVLPPR